MPTYFDAAVPVDPSGSTFATNLVRCNVCGVFIRNIQGARDLHASWHDTMPKGAASGIQSNTANIAAGATGDIVVALGATMPAVSYVASPTLLSASGTLLGTVSIVGVQSQTTSSVTVRIKNTGLSVLTPGTVAVGVIAIG